MISYWEALNKFGSSEHPVVVLLAKLDELKTELTKVNGDIISKEYRRNKIIKTISDYENVLNKL